MAHEEVKQLPAIMVDKRKPADLIIVKKQKLKETIETEKVEQEEQQLEEPINDNQKEIEEIWKEYDRDQMEIMEAWDDMLAEREQEEKQKNVQVESTFTENKNEVIEDNVKKKDSSNKEMINQSVTTINEESKIAIPTETTQEIK
jgi:hypothetical protein